MEQFIRYIISLAGIFTALVVLSGLVILAAFLL